MVAVPHVNIFGKWCKLEYPDIIDDKDIDKWLDEHDLMNKPISKDFIKVVHKGDYYLLHKSNFTFVLI